MSVMSQSINFNDICQVVGLQHYSHKLLIGFSLVFCLLQSFYQGLVYCLSAMLEPFKRFKTSIYHIK